MEHNLLNELIIILSASVLAAALFNRLHVPTIICYLLVGILVGPSGLELVKDATPFQLVA